MTTIPCPLCDTPMENNDGDYEVNCYHRDNEYIEFCIELAATLGTQKDWVLRLEDFIRTEYEMGYINEIDEDDPAYYVLQQLGCVP